jgi:lysophospholipase L1-like esterase
MVRTILLLLLCSTGLMAQNINPGNPLRFLALGDSYTIGQGVPASGRWPVQLADSLNARGIMTDTLSIIATTGWRTDNLLNAITNQNLESRNYNFVSLLIGVNNQYQNRPFSQYQAEFPALLDSAIRYAGGDKSRVFVVSIPDYAYTPYGQQSGLATIISAEIDQYNLYNQHVADSMQVTYFDITPISRQGLQYPSYVAPDGLHPSSEQYTKWVELMLQAIDNQPSAVQPVEAGKGLPVVISPNPATDLIRIEVPGAAAAQVISAGIYTLNGKLVLEKNFTGSSCSLSLAALPDGTYMVKIIAGEAQAVKKVVKRMRQD